MLRDVIQTHQTEIPKTPKSTVEKMIRRHLRRYFLISNHPRKINPWKLNA